MMCVFSFEILFNNVCKCEQKQSASAQSNKPSPVRAQQTLNEAQKFAINQVFIHYIQVFEQLDYAIATMGLYLVGTA